MLTRYRGKWCLPLLCCWAAIAHPADIYRWRDDQGQVHFGDRAASPPEALPLELPRGNTPLPATPVPAEPAPPAATAPPPRLTGPEWADRHCRTRLRIYYTEHWLAPCLPTAEVPVHVCDREPPRRLLGYFGRRYHYRDRASECGPEVFSGEILYLKTAR